MDTKRCSVCGEVKGIEEFYKKKNESGTYGFDSRCKTCVKEYAARRHAENPHKKRESEARRRAEHPDRKRESDAKYYAKNRDKIRESTKRYRSQNIERVKAMKRLQRARKRNAPGSCTAVELNEQFKRQKGRCHWCGCKISTQVKERTRKEGKLGRQAHHDHVIPLSRGGSNNIGNIVWACWVCNSEKSDKLPHEWRGSNGRLI